MDNVHGADLALAVDPRVLVQPVLWVVVGFVQRHGARHADDLAEAHFHAAVACQFVARPVLYHDVEVGGLKVLKV